MIRAQLRSLRAALSTAFRARRRRRRTNDGCQPIPGGVLHRWPDTANVADSCYCGGVELWPDDDDDAYWLDGDGFEIPEVVELTGFDDPDVARGYCRLHPYETIDDHEPPGCEACAHLAVCDDPDNCHAPECVDNRSPGGRR